jgi:hypothetical protein
VREGAAERRPQLGAGRAEHVTQHPQKLGVAVDVDLMECAVDLRRESYGCRSRWLWAERTRPADLDSRPAAYIDEAVLLTDESG